MLKNVLLLLVFLCTVASVNAQRNCGSMDLLAAQIEEDPKRIAKMNAIEKATQKFVNNPQKVVNGTVTIPVVVHVVYNGTTQNISTAQINSQILVLNEDFRRLNSDADGTWPQGTDSEIEFCLATVDPNGNATTGITRTSTSVNGFGTNDAVKFNSSGGKDAWPAADYMNVWVCNIGGGILGYAQFPGGSPATDGVVNDYRYFGNTGTATAPFDLGRTMTHEVGHYLNLRHIWGDGPCSVDDFVADTPTSDASNGGCNVGHVSCGTVDMVQNYMDYSDDACMNLFTAGQKTRMRAVFDTGGFRESLLTSGACGSAPTPTCNDGIQNQGETGVDCGGPNCAPCNTNCTDVALTITFDNYPEETAWSITNSSGATVASGGTYGSQADGSTLTLTNCLADGCYDFTITDTYGDGICCAYGNGSYNVSIGGSSVASGGSFASSETTNFCVGGGPVETCTDGIQNNGETGVDCGGPNCAACPPVETCTDGIQNNGETGVDCGGPNCAPCNTGGCTDVDIDFNNLDSGWANWNDGGSDCVRSTASTYAYSGTRSIRIRDNTNSSVATSDNYNLAGFEEVTVAFTYVGRSMENGEDFWLQASVDGGSSWITITTYASGSDFTNLVREFESVTMTGAFTSTTKFRFRCDASSNADYVYIDDVDIYGCVNGAREIPEAAPEAVVDEVPAQNITEVRLYPNPVAYDLNLDISSFTTKSATFAIYNVTGRLIQQFSTELESGTKTQKISTENMEAGVYYVNIIQGDQRIVKKFIVIK